MSGLIVPYKGFVPKVDPTAFIAANATLVGDVEIAANASIWFGCILRGDGSGDRRPVGTRPRDHQVHPRQYECHSNGRRDGGSQDPHEAPGPIRLPARRDRPGR